MPGSPNRGFSASVPSSASSTDTDSAPASISASDRASACSRDTSMTISVQLIYYLPALFSCFRHLCQSLFQIVDVGTAFDEARINHQLAVQRNVGRDAFHHHFRQRDLHAADRLLAGCTVGNDLA